MTRGRAATSDASVIVTDHSTVDYQLSWRHTHAVVVDTRNATARVVRPKARIVSCPRVPSCGRGAFGRIIASSLSPGEPA